MLHQLITALTWALIPVGLVAIVDDWFFRPRRRIAAHPGAANDPALMRVVYGVLPVLACAAVVRMFLAERLDFSLVLVLVAATTGLVLLVEVAGWRRRRVALAQSAGKPADAAPEPGVVDYARSFFPVVLVVLIVRSFLFEPFRIPSDSMMPTLYDGDFILVNKFSYGLRLPVTNAKFVDLGEPERGDVVVFRFPPDPAINYIKRVVGLPGDKVRIESDRLFVNGEPVSVSEVGEYSDGCYQGMQLVEESLGEHKHRALFCRTSGDIATAPLPSCNRNLERGYICPSDPDPAPDRNDIVEIEVPAGNYLMIGDNRDNSADSRYFGFVPEANLIGSAKRIWFNWDLQRKGGPMWSRVGTRIE
ncbi:MAG: signal peptidase I [Steroidobacteraceae bacterium]